MPRTQIANKEGSAEQWAADVIHEGAFAARLSVSTSGGVQTVRLRRMVDGVTTPREVIAEWTAPKARPYGFDAIDDMVSEAMSRQTVAGVEHARGGWHTQHVDAVSAATGTSKRYAVTWRTQRVRCCGQTLTVAGDSEAPVWVDRSYGEIRAQVTQCRTCGSLYTARYTARRAS